MRANCIMLKQTTNQPNNQSCTQKNISASVAEQGLIYMFTDKQVALKSVIYFKNRFALNVLK